MATVAIHDTGFCGTPVAGHDAWAARYASVIAASTRSNSPRRRHNPANTCACSVRNTCTAARAASAIPTKIHALDGGRNVRRPGSVANAMRRRSLSTFSMFLVAACGGSGATRTTPPTGPAPVDTATATEPAAPATTATPATQPAAVGHPRNDLIPRAVLFGNPERGAPQLSPDGKRIAYSA